MCTERSGGIEDKSNASWGPGLQVGEWPVRVFIRRHGSRRQNVWKLGLRELSVAMGGGDERR